MVKCPFCHFDNEDGALFCEQCKSDLAGVEPVVTAEPIPAAAPVAAAEIIETVPLESVPEGTPVVEAIMAEAMPAPAEVLPVETVAPIPLAPDIPAAETVTPPQTAPFPEAAFQTAVPSAPTEVPAAAPTSQATPAPAAAPGALPPDAQPRLVVLRGLKRNVEYPIYEGHNFIGRADEKPVDIDLDDQEPPDRVWSSRQHALITFEVGRLSIEDLNSSNGTFVNRARIYPGQKRDLNVNDVIQIGTVQMKLIV
jgi:hypothetical protein